MRYLIVAFALALVLGALSPRDDALAASGAQTETSQQEAFDMEAAEDRWVRIGSRFFLLLIVVLLIKGSLDKKKAAASRGAPARRPPRR